MKHKEAEHDWSIVSAERSQQGSIAVDNRVTALDSSRRKTNRIRVWTNLVVWSFVIVVKSRSISTWPRLALSL